MRPDEVLERHETKRLDPSAQFALIAAREAWADAGAPEVDPERLGVDFATGIGGLWTLLDAWDTLAREGPAARAADDRADAHAERAPPPPSAWHLDARAFARTVVSACASSTESIVNAYEHLQLGLADVVIAGGTESAIHPHHARVVRLDAGALASATTTRRTASRPYDVDRDGFVMGEGAACARARDRGARARPAAPRSTPSSPAAA